MITFTQEEAIFIYDALRLKDGRQRTFNWFEELEKHVSIYRKFNKEIIEIEENGQKLKTFKKEVKIDLPTEEKAAIIEIIKTDSWDVGRWDIALNVKDKLK